MRRPHRHRLTRSGPRLVAVTAFAVLTGGCIVTTASASGLGVTVSLTAAAGALGPSRPLLQGLTPLTDGVVGCGVLSTCPPALSPATTPPTTPPPLPPLGTPTALPISGICLPCPPGNAGPVTLVPGSNAGNHASTPGPGPTNPGVTAVSTPDALGRSGGTSPGGSGSGTGTASGTATATATAAPGGPSSGSGAGTTQPAGLNLPQPAPVEQLTPLAGISFGQAPYLWPLFLLLDVIGAVAVAVVVRRTWSTAGAD
ncbi:MAG: hypothetical protein JF887_07195 [Candidatus Dormibacteraeota bacterium]|uniref:Uncharacterized protein n=1 Tax=Candidatus Amunia macphersoniae TaxID=3127014 RepID=A0A934NEX0_9BACT|nr:hypothetical protein [Candidatus Dormibacteraeota bacterium]